MMSTVPFRAEKVTSAKSFFRILQFLRSLYAYAYAGIVSSEDMLA